MMTYESNIPYTLRFMIDKKVGAECLSKARSLVLTAFAFGRSLA